MSLGPVIRNVLAGQHTMILKDDLALRLERAEERDNGLGALIQRDGKLAFVPNYAGDQPVPKLQPYKEPAYVPFQGEMAVLDPNLAPKAKSPMTSGSISVDTPAKPSNPRRPQVGDKVRVTATREELDMLGFSVYRGVDWPEYLAGGAVGTLVEDDKLSIPFLVRFDLDGGKTVEWWLREMHVALADTKPAFDPMTEPLRVGDIVEILYEGYQGLKGTVTDPDNIHGFIEVDGGMRAPAGKRTKASTTWGDRRHVKLIERPNT